MKASLIVKAASAALEGATVAGEPVKLTGFDALVEDSGADNEGPGVLIEALIGGFGALLVLIFVFASFLAIVPLGMAIVVIVLFQPAGIVGFADRFRGRGRRRPRPASTPETTPSHTPAQGSTS